MSVDACGKRVSIGDTVMLARTGKSAGISWKRLKVTRLTAASMWTETPSRYSYGDVKLGDLVEEGPFRLGNCIVVEPSGQA